MPKQESAGRATRLNQLEWLLLEQPERKWRTAEIAEYFGVSEDTARRDLQELSRGGTLALVTEGTTANFTWQVSPDSHLGLPPLRLNYGQGAALYAAARLLSQQQDERNDAVRSALIALISVLPKPLRPHLESVVSGMGQPKESSNITPIFEALSQGWLLRRVVSLHYEPAHGNAYTCRFAPYLLEPSGIGRTLYFLGRSDPPASLRTYKLERVRWAELTTEEFEVPADFDGVGLLRRAWGVMYGEDEPVHIKLRFSHFVSKRVRETCWHASQRLTETPDGLIWEAEIGDVIEIRPWLRGWGADCEVLEPAALREEMIAEARRLTRLYGLKPAETNEGALGATLLDDLLGE